MTNVSPFQPSKPQVHHSIDRPSEIRNTLSPEAYNIGISRNKTFYFRQSIHSRAIWYINPQGFFCSSKIKERTNGSPPSGKNVEKENQQHYEQKWKRRFQKKWIEEFDSMDITKYPSGQNKHTTLMQNTKWST